MKYLLFKTTNINQKGIGLDPFLGSILDIHHNVTILGGAASEEARGWGLGGGDLARGNIEKHKRNVGNK